MNVAWSGCSQKGPPWASDTGSWNWILNLLHAWMMLGLPKPSGRPRYSTRAQPMPFRSPLGQHAGVRTWGNGNWRAGPWNLHWSLWGGSVDLPTGVWEALHYPPQILTSDITLAALLLSIEGRDMVPTSPTPGVFGTSTPQTGGKCQHCSCNQCTHS